MALWDLRDLSVVWTRELSGGVGLGDQLQDRLAFSADGRGAVKNPRTLPSVRAPAGYAVAFDGARVWLINDAGALTFLSRGGASTPGPRLLTAPARAVAASRDAIALGSENGEVALLDRATGAVRQQIKTKPVQAMRFSMGGTLAIVHAPSGAGVTRASVLRAGQLSAVDAALARHDWMSFADGVPLAVSPASATDAAAVATISPAGEVQLGTLAASARWIATVAGATGLVWPSSGSDLRHGSRESSGMARERVWPPGLPSRAYLLRRRSWRRRATQWGR